MEQYYLYILALHIIFVVCWMAGLFYIVRLFIYHTEANSRPDLEREILQKQFVIMERKLWYIITVPAMVLTVLAGLGMIATRPGLLHAPWLHVKLTFVVFLLFYHFRCQRIMKRMEQGIFKLSSMQLRLWNELATILLFAIVFTVVLKNAIDWMYGLAGLVIFALVLMIAVKLYKNYRKKKENN
ncbi:protoporphyrinogen oxidase HemJ [Pedobacter sp. MC2016-15]|uniref:protoporphyrinogen oxidase HemJ n=1 Tax=Pedobacter sp. MC2016-15 TaxID=2994473 RepID=UPI002245B69C|nr:protoporphyrinogen oxidase HemJ [Pedobacter sp. MC2016-15]MCX2480906.1 protoporphyrinogen oxidase HemJ [Pedobacter sp. MC2016-15]